MKSIRLCRHCLSSADKEDDYSALTADFNPPTIELRLGTEDRIVIFCLNIHRGKLKYWHRKDGAVSAENLELPCCVLAVSVNLTFEGVDFHNLPQEIQNRLKVNNDYNVRQLLVDFTSTSLARLDKQRTTIQDHIKDPSTNAAFSIFIEKYFIILSNNNDAVLHYLPLVNTEKRKQYTIPTVPPTDFTFQNLPFVVSAADNGRASDDNMLAYLQITGDMPMPCQLLPISAIWAVPMPDDAGRCDGTVALSWNIFLEGWLLPRLVELNKQSTYIMTDAWWSADTLANTKFSLGGHLGRDDATTNDLQFRPVRSLTEDDKVGGLFSGVDLETPGHWYEYKFENSKADGVGFWTVRHSGGTANYLSIPEGYNKDGKCEIFLTGSILIKYYVHVYLAPLMFWIDPWKWSTSIILDGVDGELAIQVDKSGPIIEERIDEPQG